MIKLNILDKFKNKPELKSNETTHPETVKVSKKILTEYNETLYSGRVTSRKKSEYLEKNIINSKQRIWRNLDDIEDNINGLRRGKTKTGSSEIGGKIDRLLARKKKK
jgi:hypothetical protein